MLARKPYLINRALKSYLFATILTMSVVQVNSVIDSILMGQFLGPDALSAITLSGPIMSLIISFYILLAAGAALLAGKAIGERDFDRASQIFSVSLVSLFAVGLTVSIVGCIFSKEIVGLFCKDTRLIPYLNDYMRMSIALSFVAMMAQGMSQFTDVDGKPQEVARSMSFCVLVNIIFDILLVAVFRIGIIGSAIASSLGYLTCIIALFPHTFGRKSSYHFRFVVPKMAEILKNNIKNGSAMVLMSLAGAAGMFIMNSLVLSSLGADGMFVMSIAGALMSIGALLASGASQAFVAVGTMLLGQKDYKGMRFLFMRCFWLVMTVAFAVTILGVMKPDLFAVVFGADSEQLVLQARQGVKIVILMLIPLLVVSMMPAVYQVLGHLPLAGSLSILFYTILLPVMWIFSKSGTPSNIWYSFPIAGWGAVALSGITILLFQRKCPQTQPFTLIPTIDCTMNILELSIPCNSDSVREATGEINAYLSSLPDGKAYLPESAEAVQEILQNIVQHSGMDSSHLVDVRAYCEGDRLEFSVKDNGKAFDPTLSANQKEGLSRVSSSCSKFEYKYMYGQNMVFLTYSQSY